MTDLRKAAHLAKIALEDIKSKVVESDWDSHYALQAEALKILEQALANEALDRMVAENQRLGLYDD